MKSSVYLVIVFFCASCITVSKRYVPVTQIDPQNNSTFKKDALNFSVEVSPGDNKKINAYLWFDSDFAQEGIKDMIIDLSLGGTSNISLKAVKMTCLEKGIDAFKDSRFIVKNFKQLPEETRVTSIEGARVMYSFEFYSDKKIRTNKITFLYRVDLNRSTKSDSMELKLVKSNHLSIH